MAPGTWRIALTAYALIVGHSIAQCNNATTTIHGSADIAPLTGCKTFTGTIAVATDSDSVIELNGVEKIDGDFIASDNAHVTTLASNSLVEATGKVEFSNLGVLANISLPAWERTGTLILDRIPAPSFTNFQQKGQQIYEVYVRNTTLAFFQGLTLIGAQIDVLEIVDNDYLQLVDFRAGNITKSCKITGNGGDLTLQLPNLTYAYSLEISNASEIDLPMLSSVSNGMNIADSEVSELSMPELTYVGGDMVIANNQHLDTLGLDELVNVQANLQITGNDDLVAIDGLPYLSSVGGDLQLSGSFESIDLPALGIVRSDIAITSTGSLNCSDIPESLARGSYSCNGNSATSSTEGTSTKGSNKGLSTGAKAGVAVGVIAAVALLAALAFYFWRRRQRSTHSQVHGNVEPAPPYNSGGGYVGSGERKDDCEMEYYTVPPHHDGGSTKELIERSAEMGRPLSSGRPGPEGRHEAGMGAKDLPAACELPADGQVEKETG